MEKRVVGIILVSLINLFLFGQGISNGVSEILTIILIAVIFNGISLFLSWVGFQILKYTKNRLGYFVNVGVLTLFMIVMLVLTFTDPTWDAILWALLAVSSIFAIIEVVGIYLIIYDKYIVEALVVKKEKEWYEKEL